MAPASAPAEPVSEAASARELHDEGVRLFGEGRFAEAAEAFVAAERLVPNPLNVYNEARCYQELGELQRAEAALDRYLGTPGLPTEDRAAAEELRAAVRTRAREPGPAEGGAFEATPEPEPEPSVPVSVALEPAAAAERAAREGSTRGSVTLPAPEERTLRSPAAERAGRRAPAGGWTLLGSGLALLLAGGVLDAVAYAESDPARYDQLGSLEEWESWRAEVHGTAIAGDVLVGLGAAVAVAGVLWLVLGRRDRPTRARSRASVAVFPRAGARAFSLGVETSF